MRIAIDVMGGDYAPAEILNGAFAAARANADRQIILVGQEEVIKKRLIEMKELGDEVPANISAVFAEDVMDMDESVTSLLKKKKTSIWIATQLVKTGEADAIVSAGSTGAQMACAMLLLGRCKGVDRPCIAIHVPGGGRLLLDTGANVECTPELLEQFAHLGSVYMQVQEGIAEPKVALLSNGTEDHKGTPTVQAAHALLRESKLNFIGNLEGRDLLRGDYNVMVSDGFSGNIALKSTEGAALMIMDELKKGISQSFTRKIGALLIKPVLRGLKKSLDYKEHGGGPLLGVNGVSIVCHGSSDARAIENAIGLAERCVAGNFVGKVTEEMTKVMEEKAARAAAAAAEAAAEEQK